MVSRRRAAASIVFCSALAFSASPSPAGGAADFDTVLAEADEQYARRADGATGALALPGPVDAATLGYRRALELRQDSCLARSKLLRALFFRARFCGADADERKRRFEEARLIADEGVTRLEQAASGRKGASRIAALREIPDAGEALYWAAVAWGEWALARGRLAAASAGAAGRIRDLAQSVIDLDPQLEEGGGYRILGRLHDQSPKIPFVTGFVSRQEALSLLRRAHEVHPGNKVNQLFLAEAILRHEPGNRAEARALLERCATAEPRAEYLVEDAHYAALARDLLATPR
jgi:hypothetical protein